jgi:small subunit ribosomal protein S6
MEFAGEGQEIVSNLEVTYKRDERILRFLTVALDKHAAAYADKRKGLVADGKMKKKEAATS